MNLYYFVLRRIGNFVNAPCQRRYLSHSKLHSFYERDSRGEEYPVFVDKPWQEIVKESGPAFIQECKKFWEETKEHFQQDHKLYQSGDTEVFWRFDSEVKCN